MNKDKIRKQKMISEDKKDSVITAYFKTFASQWQIQLMALLGIMFILIFNYIPMAGVLIAFKDTDFSINIMKTFQESSWVGLQFFHEFIYDEMFRTVLVNTIGLNLLQLALGFPAPIIFAILLNEVRHRWFKRSIQTITYFPHFVSWIVFGGIIISMISIDTGFFNDILISLGIIKNPVNFLGESQYFWWLVVISSLIKGIGWGSIIYLATISGIDPQLYEAATIDGAGRFRKILHITLPGMKGTIIIFLLLSISGLLNSGFDRIWVFQNPQNIARSEVLDTFVFKVGIRQMRYSYTTAVGLFKSVVALIMLTIGHYTSKRIAGRGLF